MSKSESKSSGTLTGAAVGILLSLTSASNGSAQELQTQPAREDTLGASETSNREAGLPDVLMEFLGSQYRTALLENPFEFSALIEEKLADLNASASLEPSSDALREIAEVQALVEWSHRSVIKQLEEAEQRESERMAAQETVKSNQFAQLVLDVGSTAATHIHNSNTKLMERIKAGEMTLDEALLEIDRMYFGEEAPKPAGETSSQETADRVTENTQPPLRGDR